MKFKDVAVGVGIGYGLVRLIGDDVADIRRRLAPSSSPVQDARFSS